MDLDTIASEIHKCTSCPLNQLPYMPGLLTPGIGNPNAKILIIGRDPGAEEAKEGIPFIDRAGQLLQSVLVKCNLTLEDVFITNIVKHRPPNNREPTKEEQTICSHWLVKQIQAIQPEYIITLGATATQLVASLENIQIPTSRLRGLEFELWSQTLTPIVVKSSWHPSYIIRGNWEAKEELKADILSVMDRL